MTPTDTAPKTSTSSSRLDRPASRRPESNRQRLERILREMLAQARNQPATPQMGLPLRRVIE